MTERQSLVISLRKECKSMNLIADEVGISRQRVGQILLQFFPDHVNYVLQKLQERANALREEKPVIDKRSLNSLVKGEGYKNLPPEVKLQNITPSCVTLRPTVLALRENGLTQKEIGIRLGFDQVWVSKVIGNRFASPLTVPPKRSL